VCLQTLFHLGIHYKLTRSAFLVKKAYHSMSIFLIYHIYGRHCLPKLFVLNLCLSRGTHRNDTTTHYKTDPPEIKF
jgi:hypothetical protein